MNIVSTYDSLIRRIRIWSGGSVLKKMLPKRRGHISPVSSGLVGCNSVTPINAAQPNEHVTVVGMVYSLTYQADETLPPRAIALLSDGTGTVELSWLGRPSISGIHIGCYLGAEGRIGVDRGRFIIRNPMYFIFDEEKNGLT